MIKAKAIIASLNLRSSCDYRISLIMSNDPRAIIEHLGGTCVARLIEAPVSTVQSWKTKGIPPSRLAHLRLAAREIGKSFPEEMA
jgi:hypothetical protein